MEEWLFPTPEIRGSNPVIGKFYLPRTFVNLLSTLLKRQKRKEKEEKRKEKNIDVVFWVSNPAPQIGWRIQIH